MNNKTTDENAICCDYQFLDYDFYGYEGF